MALFRNISPSGTNPALTDQVVSVAGGATDKLFTVQQLANTIGGGGGLSVVTSIAALQALSTSNAVAYLELGGQSGLFTWNAGVTPATILGDVQQGLYVSPSAMQQASFATTLNPSDQSNITLSGSNLTATASASNGRIRSNSAHLYEKVYLETTIISGVSTGNFAIGFSPAAASLTNSYMGLAPDSAAIFNDNPNEAFSNNGAAAGFGLGFTFPSGTMTNGDVVALAIDFGAQLLWLKNLTSGPASWNASGSANPATGVGGVPFLGFAKGYLLYFSLALGVSSSSASVNFGGSAFTGTVPSGFSSWNTNAYALSTSGAWVRQFSGSVNSQWFGMDPTGNLDNFPMMQAALNNSWNNYPKTNNSAASTYGQYPLYIPEGNYYFGSQAQINNGFGGVLEGAGKYSTTLFNNGGTGVIKTNGFRNCRVSNMQLSGAGGVRNLIVSIGNTASNSTPNSGSGPRGSGTTTLVQNTVVSTAPSGIYGVDNLTNFQLCDVPGTGANLAALQINAVPNVTYTTQIWLSSSDSPFVQIVFQDAGTANQYASAIFSLADGTIGEQVVGSAGGVVVSASTSGAAGGYYCTLQAKVGSGVEITTNVLFAAAKTGNSYNSHGTVLVSGASNAFSMNYDLFQCTKGTLTGLAKSTDVLFDYDWDGTNANATNNLFENVAFNNCYYGIRAGWSGHQCDETNFIQCDGTSCAHSWLSLWNFNALALNIFGGDIEGCNVGIWINSGSIGGCMGTGFEQNQCSVYCAGSANDAITMVGTRVEDEIFIVALRGSPNLNGCSQNPGTTLRPSQIFVASQNHPVTMNNCVTTSGTIFSNQGGVASNCEFGLNNPVVSSSLPIRMLNSYYDGTLDGGGLGGGSPTLVPDAWITSGPNFSGFAPFTYTQFFNHFSNGVNFSDCNGVMGIISDCTVTTGAVTTGGGAHANIVYTFGTGITVLVNLT